MKRLKNIEGKNKDQLHASKDQGEKQLDATEKQKENKLKMNKEDDKIVHLEDKIDKLFEMYPNSFNKQSTSLLKILKRNENKINYKNLSYETLFPDGSLHKISFLKKYGTLSSLLKDLVTRKVNLNNANDAQKSFIVDLMHGYNDWDFDKKTDGILIKKQK